MKTYCALEDDIALYYKIKVTFLGFMDKCQIMFIFRFQYMKSAVISLQANKMSPSRCIPQKFVALFCNFFI